MPVIHGRYYANPSYGEALERAREEDAERRASRESGEKGDEADHSRDTESARDSAHGVHHIHIRREPDGILVHVHRHGPGSVEGHPEPSGHWESQHFAHHDHQGVGELVSHVLSHRDQQTQR